MADKRLVREPGTVHPRRGRLERAPGAESADATDARAGRREAGGWERERVGRGERAERGDRTDDTEGRGGRRGRPALLGEVGDLNRGALFAGVESAAIALDVASRVLRGAIDRAFDEDYNSPGDIVRGVTGEVDQAGFDLVGELRRVPRRLAGRFDEAMRSPRADQGERRRRDQEEEP